MKLNKRIAAVALAAAMALSMLTACGGSSGGGGKGSGSSGGSTKIGTTDTEYGKIEGVTLTEDPQEADFTKTNSYALIETLTSPSVKLSFSIISKGTIDGQSFSSSGSGAFDAEKLQGHAKSSSGKDSISFIEKNADKETLEQIYAALPEGVELEDLTNSEMWIDADAVYALVPESVMSAFSDGKVSKSAVLKVSFDDFAQDGEEINLKKSLQEMQSDLAKSLTPENMAKVEMSVSEGAPDGVSGKYLCESIKDDGAYFALYYDNYGLKYVEVKGAEDGHYVSLLIQTKMFQTSISDRSELTSYKKYDIYDCSIDQNGMSITKAK